MDLQKLWNTYWFPLLLILITIPYLGGLFTPIYGVDARIYASIAKEVSESNNWSEIYLHGKDYLDKPPLLFWLSAISFKIFGFSSFAYKLPSFIFTLLGVYSTYKLGKMLYSNNTGKLAALIYYSSFTIILSNQDVRTDSMLTNTIIFSTWQLFSFLKSNHWISFVGAFVGMGLAMLSKGPIGFLIPLVSVGTDLILKKQWHILFQWKWILGSIIVLIIISPALIGLYNQFDNQPNKVFSLSSGTIVQNYSGIKFYLWDQSFGRILGGNKENWDNGLTPLFFTHTYLWAFLPWFALGIVALFSKIKINLNDLKNQEWITISGIIFPFILISISSYKLPHYINPIIPFISVVSAQYLAQKSKAKWLSLSQSAIAITSLTLTLFVSFYLVPVSSILIGLVLVLMSLMLISSLLLRNIDNQVILRGIISIVLVTTSMNFHFIPELSKYHASYQAALVTKRHNISTVYTNNIIQSLSFDIYSNAKLVELEDLKNISEKSAIYVNQDWYDQIINDCQIDTIYTFYNREISNITLPFLIEETRMKHVSTFYLFILK
ncbi:MAG: glycosyltransferase family 39 protein [Flavobacteriales bacterium]|nr:glycosyltransferase family 39 protein [Flavobacteriales bacterium]